MQKTVIILSILALIASSCGQITRKHTDTESDIQIFQDTLIIKHKRILSESDVRWYSKAYFYYWLVGKDTLDFGLGITEWNSDSRLSLQIFHREPILFSDVLGKIKACLPLIKEDFDLSKLELLNFKELIFYLDLVKKLSSEYEQEFGRKDIEYRKLNEFLLKSSLNAQLNHFLNPLNKKVKRYFLEKFRLVNKEDSIWYWQHVDFQNAGWQNVDLTEYPEFILYSYTGISVRLENKGVSDNAK